MKRGRLRRFSATWALLSACVALPITAVASGYGELRRQLEADAPSFFYLQHLTAPATEVQPPAATASTDATTAAATAELEKEAAAGGRPAPFFSLSDGQRARMQEFAANDRAMTAVAAEFSLATLELLALARSPMIKAAAAREQAARQSITQAANLDAILRQYSAFSEALMTGVGPMKAQGPQAGFPFPAVAALKGRIAADEVAAAAEGLEIARRSAATMAARQYWNLLFNRRAQRFNREMVDLLTRLEAVARGRYEAGQAGFQDVVQAQINLAIQEDEVKTLAETGAAIEQRIRQLVDLPAAAPVGAPAAARPLPVAATVAELQASADEYRQELRAERIAIRRMERMIALGESMILPPFTLDLSRFADQAVMQVGSGAMQPSFPVGTEAQMGAGLPKAPWFGTNDAFLERSRRTLAARRGMLAAMEQETAALVREKWLQLDRAGRQQALYAGNIVGLSQAALDVAVSGYEAGRTMFAEVVAAAINLLKARLAQARGESDMGIGRSELEETVGRRLP